MKAAIKFAGLSVLLVLVWGVPPEVSAQAPPAMVRVDAVRFERLVQTVPVIGRLVARQSGRIASRIDGPVRQVWVQVGDRVDRGQLIAELDTATLNAQYALAEAGLAETKALLVTRRAELDLAQQEVARLQGVKNSAVTRAAVDDAVQKAVIAEAKVGEAQAAADSATASVQLVNLGLEHTRVHAPYAGVIVKRSTESGAYVKTGETVAEIIADGSLEVEADIPFNRLSGLTPGTTVHMFLDDSSAHSATVRAILPQEHDLTRTRVARFVPTFQEQHVPLAIDQSVTLHVPVGAPRTVLSVHKDGIIKQRGKDMVYVVTDDDTAMLQAGHPGRSGRQPFRGGGGIIGRRPCGRTRQRAPAAELQGVHRRGHFVNLIHTAIHRPIAVISAVLMTVLFGVVALTTIPIQLAPDVNRPVITVTTQWPGAAPAEVEREIVNRQEEQFSGLQGLESITGRAEPGRSQITLEFSVGTNMDRALLLVANRLDRVASYPDEVDQPTLDTAGSEDSAIAWFILTRDEGNQRPVHEYGDFVKDVIKERIERVPGVSRVDVYGGSEREIHIIVDPELLARYRVTVPDLANALRSANASMSAGDVDEGKRRYVVRAEGELNTLDAVRHVVVRSSNQTAGGGLARVTVGDIAEVGFGYKEPTASIRLLGNESLAMSAKRQTGANVIETMAGIVDAIEELNATAIPGSGLNLRQVYNETVYINSAIDLVKQNIWIGGSLAVLLLLDIPAFAYGRRW